jgi:RND family efflux transporter MFP subunit
LIAAVLGVCVCLATAGCGDDSAGEDDETGDAAVADATGAEQDSAGEDRKEGDAETAEKKDDKPKKELSTSIHASPVARGPLVIPVVAEGSIRARNVTDIKFEIGGTVHKVWVTEGQRVRRGQKLVTLDDREVRLALEEARSRYLQALGQLAVEEEGYSSKTAEGELQQRRDELKQLEREGKIARRERLDRELDLGMEAVRNGAYRRELLEVRSGLASSRADAARLELDLEKTVIEAPFSGVITGLALNANERVQLGQSVARLVDDINIEAEVAVLESDLGGLAVGRSARLTIPALGETLDLEVDVISPEIDEDSRTCKILLRLDSDKGRIKPGMFARAAIAGQIYEDKLLVPREAILTRDGRPMLFRVEGDRAKWVYVKLGLRNDHVVEIAGVTQGGPLDPETLVVVGNHLTLTHDAKIKVSKTLPISDPWVQTIEQ